MSTKLYIGGINYKTTDQGLQEAFAPAGNVLSARIIMDKMTGRSRGFGFVEFESEEDANKAVEMWDGKELEGRKLIVNVARPMEERAPRRDSNSNSGGGNNRW